MAAPLALLLAELAAELALIAAGGCLLFALDDLAVDLIYLVRRGGRSSSSSSDCVPGAERPGWMAVLIPAWDEAAVIASMLRSTLDRFGDGEYLLFAGHYRNDPATAAAIAEVADPRVVAVRIDRDGPTTKADCLNLLYGIM